MDLPKIPVLREFNGMVNTPGLASEARYEYFLTRATVGDAILFPRLKDQPNISEWAAGSPSVFTARSAPREPATTCALAAAAPWCADIFLWSERTYYEPGVLAKFWPKTIEPCGRIHFAGAYADNLSWGQEAATRSARRVAEEIDKA